MNQEIPFPSDNRDGSGFEEAENVKIPADWLAEFDAAALLELEFELTDEQTGQIEQGKDFVQSVVPSK